jgi:hypothetical protein
MRREASIFCMTPALLSMVGANRFIDLSRWARIDILQRWPAHNRSRGNLSVPSSERAGAFSADARNPNASRSGNQATVGIALPRPYASPTETDPAPRTDPDNPLPDLFRGSGERPSTPHHMTQPACTSSPTAGLRVHRLALHQDVPKWAAQGELLGRPSGVPHNQLMPAAVESGEGWAEGPSRRDARAPFRRPRQPAPCSRWGRRSERGAHAEPRHQPTDVVGVRGGRWPRSGSLEAGDRIGCHDVKVGQ